MRLAPLANFQSKYSSIRFSGGGPVPAWMAQHDASAAFMQTLKRPTIRDYPFLFYLAVYFSCFGFDNILFMFHFNELGAELRVVDVTNIRLE